MRHILIIIFLILTLTSLRGQYFIPTFYDIQPEVEDNGYKALFPSQHSFLYTNAQEGFIRYDGKNIDVLLAKDQYPASVSATYQDGDELWVGCTDGSVWIYRQKEKSRWKPWEKINTSKITHLEKDLKGRMWVTTYGNGVYVYDGTRLQQFTKEDGLGGLDIYDAVLTITREFVISTDHGLYACTFDQQKKKVKRLDKGGDTKAILTELWYDQKNGWIAGRSYEGKAYIIQVQQGIMKPLDFPFTIGQGITLHGEWLFVVDEKGPYPVWAHNIITGETEKFFLKGLDNDISVVDMITHEEGIIWISCKNNGLLSIHPSIALYDLPQDNLQSLAYHPKGLFLGFEKGLMFRHWNHQYSEILRDENILSLFYDNKHDVLWIGTYGKGLIKYFPAKKTMTRFDEKTGLINNNVFSIQPQGDNIWISTLAGIQKLSSSGSNLDKIQSQDGLPTDYVYTMYIGKDSTLWLGTEGKGLVHVKGENIRQVYPDVSVISLAEDGAGNIWFVTLEKGLGKWDGRNISILGKNDGLTSHRISGIFADPFQTLFVFHESGIDKINVSKGSVLYLGNIPGFNKWKLSQNAVSLKSKNEVFVGMFNQVVRFFPNFNKNNGPKLLTLQTACGNILIPENQKTQLSWDNHNFRAEFAGLYFEDPEQVHFRYKLEPLETEWRYTRDPKLVYTELQPGDYTFTIQVGVANQFFGDRAKKFSFIIHPAFTQTPWFYVLSIIFITAVIYGYFYYRNRQKKKVSDLENEKVRMQLETLKSQINPHFLFNSFNTLIGTIEEDKESAITYVEKLSDFYRSMLEYRDTNVIPLREEISLLDNYIFLLKQRYGDNIAISIEILDFEDACIIPLTLQLLTENAIKHNVVSKATPLWINIKKIGDEMVVSNPIQPRMSVEKSTHFGLNSLDKRYQELMNKKIHIETSNQIFIVRIPLAPCL